MGGNLGETEITFNRALERLSTSAGEILARSQWRLTPPLLHPEFPQPNQGPYLNGALLLRSALAPEALMRFLLETEHALGRDRSRELRPWSPRVIDLDLIAAGELVISTPQLTLPHPRMHTRRFVLEPLLEIAPDWVHPVLKRSVKELHANLSEEVC